MSESVESAESSATDLTEPAPLDGLSRVAPANAGFNCSRIRSRKQVETPTRVRKAADPL